MEVRAYQPNVLATVSRKARKDKPEGRKVVIAYRVNPPIKKIMVQTLRIDLD